MSINVGDRVEIPTHYDMWMHGARFGVVEKVDKDFIRVRMDNPTVRGLVPVRVGDGEYMKKVSA